MVIKFINKIKEIDKHTIKLIKLSVTYSFLFCVFGSIVLFSNFFVNSIDLYGLGILLVQTGLVFVVESVICGIAVDTIKKQLV